MKEDNPSLSEEWIMQKITALVSDFEEQGQESSRWEQGNEYLSQEQLNSLPDVIDEEVTSIITIEDVMEKLLQFNAVVPSKPSPPSAVVDADAAGSSNTSPLQDYDGEGDDEHIE
ncbi:hypothetical protein JHK82_024379 [Glycine max]|nr:hypothetical protein JHK85_024963 [Glycine max]KAG5012211.1 hypothetical protein JHK86_024472 [Glycine max]KAG5133191.1 hypothetical protein JHK82_024379 [Glycine max]